MEAYREALVEQPFAVEIYQSLITLGASADELLQQHGERLNKLAPWIVTYLTTQRDIQRLEYKAALAALGRLEERFKGSLVLLLAMAHCHFKQVNMKEAYHLYKRVHAANKYILDSMDQFAAIIKFNGHMAEMNTLADELFSVSQDRTESWMVMSRYCEMKGDVDRALSLADKATKLGPSSINAYLLKGGLLMSSKPTEALYLFQQAYQLQVDMDSVRGLVEVYIQLGKYPEALALAKETLQRHPKNARALTLIGSVLSRRPESREKARKALTNALLLEPNAVETIVTLVAVLISENNVPEALKQLEAAALRNNSDYIHVRLADVYALTHNFAKALEHYSVSLSFNPYNQRALEGIKRVEKIMEGDKEQQGQGDDGAAEGEGDGDGDGDDPMNG